MKQNRRGRKKHPTGLLAFLLLIAVFVGIAFLVASPPASHSSVQTARFNDQSQSIRSPTQAEDAFFGSVLNVLFTDSTTGLVKADTNCKPVEDGLTNCTAIIAADGAELHFNYSHDMSKQECLGSGDQVAITLLANGTVKVVRG